MMAEKTKQSKSPSTKKDVDPYASFEQNKGEKIEPASVRARYPLSADSEPQPGVPVGNVMKRAWTSSEIYPDSKTDYWVYVPAQYVGSEPASLMVFQDGQGFVSTEGSVRVPIVFDNLIHRGEMPVTIGVFINPAAGELPWDHRERQYTPLNDTYARFLIDEILVEVGKDYNLTEEAEGRAICGMSDGGLCAFTVGWERTDYFSKVVSHIGSFTRQLGGSQYPYLIRKTRGNPKPLRVFLQDGENDINLQEGDWYLANRMMQSAMQYARWDHRVVWGSGGHDLIQGGAIFPDTIRWLWRDYPGVQNSETDTNPKQVTGHWDVLLNNGGVEHTFELDVTVEGEKLSATLANKLAESMPVRSIELHNDVLGFEFATPESLMNLGKGPTTDREPLMIAWVKVGVDYFSGALSNNSDHVFDLNLTGRRTT